MIIVRYYAIDGFKMRRDFAVLARAQAFAWKWVGENAELGSNYAVSNDGIGKITVSGDATLAQVMGREPIEEALPFEVWVAVVNEDAGTSQWSKSKAFATYAEAQAYAGEVDQEGADGVTIKGATDEAKIEVEERRQAWAEKQANDAYWDAEYKAIETLLRPTRRPGCTCSDMQLNLVGCDCAVSYN